MSNEPLVGIADDYLCTVLTELGSETVVQTLEHIGIDDKDLVKDAIELPNLLFYYSAVYERISLRVEQKKIELKEVEARHYVSMREISKASGETITVDELNARITLEDDVGGLRRRISDLTAKRESVKAVTKALERKGFSLQLVGNIRSRESDWLRQSFAKKLEGNPNQNRIMDLLNQVLGSA